MLVPSGHCACACSRFSRIAGRGRALPAPLWAGREQPLLAAARPRRRPCLVLFFKRSCLLYPPPLSPPSRRSGPHRGMGEGMEWEQEWNWRGTVQQQQTVGSALMVCQESMKGLEVGLRAARGLGCGAQKDFVQGVRFEWGMTGCGRRGLFVSPLVCSGAIVVAGAGALTSQWCWR